MNINNVINMINKYPIISLPVGMNAIPTAININTTFSGVIIGCHEIILCCLKASSLGLLDTTLSLTCSAIINIYYKIKTVKNYQRLLLH